MDGAPVKGLEELKAKFAAIPAKLRARYLRNWLAAGARIVQTEAKRPGNAPVLAQERATPQRKPGTVRDAIRVRTSKRDKRAGDVGVFVNVKPAKGADKGAKSPRDPFYWRWLEFGWNPAKRGESKRQRRALVKSNAPKRHQGYGFLQKAAEKLPEALRSFEAAAGKWFDKINRTGKVT